MQERKHIERACFLPQKTQLGSSPTSLHLSALLDRPRLPCKHKAYRPRPTSARQAAPGHTGMLLTPPPSCVLTKNQLGLSTDVWGQLHLVMRAIWGHWVIYLNGTSTDKIGFYETKGTPESPCPKRGHPNPPRQVKNKVELSMYTTSYTFKFSPRLQAARTGSYK